MSEQPDVDLDELRGLVDELDEATVALREYGEENDIPAIERGAKRVEGTVATIRQNVPGGLTGKGDQHDDRD